MNTTHLTEEQIDDLLIEGLESFTASSPAAAAHFRACDPCQLRFAEAESPVASFRDMSLAWAERRSATMPLRPAVQPAGNPRFAWASLATAGAAVLALFIALPSMHRSAPAAPSANLAAVGATGIKSITPVAATPDQISRDNQMLNEIDQALGAPSESAATYGLEPVSSHDRARSRTAVRD